MQIDVRGLECPTPLIRVKEFLESPNGNESFTVIFSANINGNASFQNVSRFLKKYNREFKKIESDDKITMEVSASSGEITKIEEKVENYCDVSNKSVVAIVKSDVIGSDEKELGRLLMHSFLKTLPSVTDEFTIKKAVFLNKFSKRGVLKACVSLLEIIPLKTASIFLSSLSPAVPCTELVPNKPYKASASLSTSTPPGR